MVDAGEYQYRIVALQDGLRSVPSNTVTASWVEPPVAPINLDISELDGDVVLAWQSQPGPQTDYGIERRRIDDTTHPWKVLASLPATEAMFLDATAVAGMVYQYRVVAINAERTDTSALVQISLSDGGGTEAGEPGADEPLVGRMPPENDDSSSSGGSGGGSAGASWLLLMLMAGLLKGIVRRRSA